MSAPVRTMSADISRVFQIGFFVAQNHQLAIFRKAGTAIALLVMQGFSITEKEERS
ncbi:MAG TPA: hypothetical protein VLZ32_08315 [Rhodanobacter sp.]|nr:hypothetical protein [Rhodanobacter sp.]